MRKKIFAFLLLLLLIGLITSCGKKETAQPAEKETQQPAAAEAVTETKDLPPVETAQYDEAMVTFFSGDVAVREGDEWYDIQIGDLLKKDDTLKVGQASYCELQFGKTAVVRIQENTEVSMKSIALAPGEANVALKMQRGSVLCKVQKLAGKEKFKVQTQTAVCGVRGTQFAVQADADQQTVLAVREGAVTVLPASVDVDTLKEQVGESNAQLVGIIDELEKSAPVVKANQEISLTQDTLKQTDAAMQEVKQTVDEIVQAARESEPSSGTEEEKAPVIKSVSPEKIASLSKSVEKTNLEVAKQVVPPKDLSDKNVQKLQEIDKMKMVEIPLGAKAEETQAEPAAKLIKISLEIQPAEAAVMLNGEQVGTGKFSGLYSEGDKLSFLVKEAGYKDYTLDLTASKETGKLYTVKLAREEAAKEETSKREKEKPKTEEAKPAKVKVEVKTDPKDAKIFMDGKELATGTYSDSFEEGKKLAFLLRKEGFEDKTLDIQVEKGKENVYQVTLSKVKPPAIISPLSVSASPEDADIYVNGKKAGRGKYKGEFEEGTKLTLRVDRKGYTPESLEIVMGTSEMNKTFTLKAKTVQVDESVTNGRIVGNIAYRGGRIYIADNKGTVTALDMDGNRIWSVATNNNPNENSSPVLIGSSVYFSGSKELTILNASTGAVLNRLPLDAESAHLFGRRVVEDGKNILFPFNKGIKLIDPSSGKTESEIAIPKGSRMTPARWKDKIVIADQQGALLFIDPAGKEKIAGEVFTAAVQPVALAPTIEKNLAVFSGRKGTVVCVDLDAKKELWERKLPGNSAVFTDIASNGSGLYVFSKGTIYGLSLKDGKDLFEPIQGTTSPPLCSGNSLYFGTEGKLEIRDSGNGGLLRSITLGGTIVSRPFLAGKQIIAGTDTGHLLVINPNS